MGQESKGRTLTMDLFAEALWQFHKTGRAVLRTERDDGYVAREDVSWYFTSPREFPAHERAALKFARGRVLDVGCGAGRHSLYLQKRGLRVTAIDISPRTVELALSRGVQDARVLDACSPHGLPFHDGEFDTVVLFGNNLGLPGTLPRFRRLLRELGRVTSPRGRILGTTRMPAASNPAHRTCLERNLARGCPIGEMRLRLVFGGRRGPWFRLLLFAPTDLMRIAWKEGWTLAHLFSDDLEQGYAAILEKTP